MKILLIGEYSGVHTDLAASLALKGHKIVAAHAGDDFKNYPRDFDLRPSGRNFVFRRFDLLRKYLKFIFFIKKEKFEIIQLINPGIFPKYLDNFIYRTIFSSDSKVFFLAAGEDIIVWEAYFAGEFRYYAFDGVLKFNKHNSLGKWKSKYIQRLTHSVLKKGNAIIPLCVEYKIAYERLFKKTPFIPLAINTRIFRNAIEKKDYSRIRILHGLNIGREGYKGSDFIVPALEKIRNEFGRDVDVIITENLPFDEYFKLLFSVNIVVDQALCYSVSMNALYSMLNGCVVLGGCEQEYLDSLAVDSAPIINILPDSNDIYNKLKELIENPNRVSEVGLKANLFVKEYHSVDRNVNMFLDVWSKY